MELQVGDLDLVCRDLERLFLMNKWLPSLEKVKALPSIEEFEQRLPPRSSLLLSIPKWSEKRGEFEGEGHFNKGSLTVEQ